MYLQKSTTNVNGKVTQMHNLKNIMGDKNINILSLNLQNMPFRRLSDIHKNEYQKFEM